MQIVLKKPNIFESILLFYNFIINFILISFVALFVIFTLMSFDDQVPLTFDRTEVSNPVVSGQEVVIKYIGVTRYRTCDVKRSAVLIYSTGKRTAFEDRGRIFSVKNFGRIPDGEMRYKTDNYSDPGPAVLKLVTKWKCPNNWYQFVYPLTREDNYFFTII